MSTRFARWHLLHVDHLLPSPLRRQGPSDFACFYPYAALRRDNHASLSLASRRAGHFGFFCRSAFRRDALECDPILCRFGARSATDPALLYLLHPCSRPSERGILAGYSLASGERVTSGSFVGAPSGAMLLSVIRSSVVLEHARQLILRCSTSCIHAVVLRSAASLPGIHSPPTSRHPCAGRGPVTVLFQSALLRRAASMPYFHSPPGERVTSLCVATAPQERREWRSQPAGRRAGARRREK
jgi:hypothetical protein